MTPPAADNPAPSVLSNADWQRLASSVQDYARAGFELLDIAAGHLGNGDLRQASEMGWGAAAQVVKAVAENWVQHGARHHSHWDLSGMVAGLSAVSPTAMPADWFENAQNLHQNFYENRLPEPTVRAYLRQTRQFVNGMTPWLRMSAPPSGFRQRAPRRRSRSRR